jgi:hypothetical protein
MSTNADAPEESQSFHFSTRVGPRWGNIDRMRTAVLSAAEAVFGRGDVSEVVGTVTSELMENAVKYGTFTEPHRVWLKVAVTAARSGLRIDVECPVDEGSDHLQSLRQTLQWIDGFPCARDAYVARIQQIADQGVDGKSGLGLVRIACEGPCSIEAAVAEGTLVVSAIVDLPDGALGEPIG